MFWSPWWIAIYAGTFAGFVAEAACMWWKPEVSLITVVIAFLLGLISVTAISLLLWLVWWRFVRWHAQRRLGLPDEKARADVEDNFRKTIGQLLGGVAVLIGAGVAYYGTLQTLSVSERRVKASRDLLISQQASKGFENLGSTGHDKLMVRLGGIYALEGVMNDPGGQYHQPVLEALCAYAGDGPPATDIQSVLTVIGRRAVGKGVIELTGAHIPRSTLAGANLRSAYLWFTDLRGAYLPSADLRGANLMNSDLAAADLSGTFMNNAQLVTTNLTGANLTNANLDGANLSVLI